MLNICMRCSNRLRESGLTMAKLFKHLGIGGKKVSDQQPCHQELMSGKASSGSVQELRSTSPSKNRASAIVVSSNSWLGTAQRVVGCGPDVSADGRRHSDASSMRSRLPNHPRMDLTLRGSRSRGSGYNRHAAADQGGGVNGTRIPCVRSNENSPQIATEYSDPFDLKKQIQAEEEKSRPDPKVCSSEDDYCVPYEVQKDNAKVSDPITKSAEDETKPPLPIANPESGVLSPTADAQQKTDDATAIPSSPTTLVSSVTSTDPEKLQNDRPSCTEDTTITTPSLDASQDLPPASKSASELTPTLPDDPEGAPVIVNPSVGMYDAPWDLWATTKHLEEKLKAAQTTPPLGRQSISFKECGAEGGTGTTQKAPYGDAAAQIYDPPWDKMAEDLQQSLYRADQEFVQRSATCEAGLKFGSLGHDPNCASHRPDMKLKQCRSVGDQQKIRTSIRTGVGCSYSPHSPMCTVQRDHSLRCRHSPDSQHFTSHTPTDCADERYALEKQTWYHGSISRVAAESLLRSHREGSYLVRTSESNKQDYSLSLKSSCGDFMHMKIVQQNSRFILGQFSQPFDSIPQMILYYTINKLPIRGTEHMTLSFPVCSDVL